MATDDPETVEETLDILRDRELLDSIRKSREEAAQGKRLRLSPPKS